MSTENLKQEQDNLIYAYGMANLRMDALRVQAKDIEQQMVEVKEKLKENIEAQKELVPDPDPVVVKEEKA